MDAKSKANFINSVAGGQKVPCPNCNALNEADSLFCFSCGTKLEGIANAGEAGASRRASARPAFQMAAPALVDEPEEISVFAEGLPDWDIVPPQVMVRRKRK